MRGPDFLRMHGSITSRSGETSGETRKRAIVFPSDGSFVEYRLSNSAKQTAMVGGGTLFSKALGNPIESASFRSVRLSHTLMCFPTGHVLEVKLGYHPNNNDESAYVSKAAFVSLLVRMEVTDDLHRQVKSSSAGADPWDVVVYSDDGALKATCNCDDFQNSSRSGDDK